MNFVWNSVTSTYSALSKTEGTPSRGDDLREQAVQERAFWELDVRITAAHVVHHSEIRELQRSRIQQTSVPKTYTRARAWYLRHTHGSLPKP